MEQTPLTSKTRGTVSFSRHNSPKPRRIDGPKAIHVFVFFMRSIQATIRAAYWKVEDDEPR